MINNKQMKLYTENQIREFLKNKQSFITLDDMYNLESIELPSDEEIHNQAFKQTRYSDSFIRGAKWMRDKIGDNNEQ